MKAIAVIKKMPKDCDECPFVNENRDCILLGEDAFPNDWVEDAPYYSLKQKGDCPLRLLPKKKMDRDVPNNIQGMSKGKRDLILHHIDVDNAYVSGWNECLEALSSGIDIDAEWDKLVNEILKKAE